MGPTSSSCDTTASVEITTLRHLMLQYYFVTCSCTQVAVHGLVQSVSSLWFFEVMFSALCTPYRFVMQKTNYIPKSDNGGHIRAYLEQAWALKLSKTTGRVAWCWHDNQSWRRRRGKWIQAKISMFEIHSIVWAAWMHLTWKSWAAHIPQFVTQAKIH